MNEAKSNPNAQAKAEGIKTGFSKEIDDIAIIAQLAEIGLAALKDLTDTEKEKSNKEYIDTLIKVGPSVIEKFTETAKYLYERSQEHK